MDQAAIRAFLGKYKHVFLILLVGILLMLLPEGGKSTSDKTPEPTVQSQQPQTLEEQLSQLLSRMEGAGQVQVLLTQARGEKTLFQTDSDTTRSEGSETSRLDTVIVSDSGRNETGLVCQVDPPTYLGAVVLCQGAENSGVRLAITEAVSNATGLGYHRITILKMK